MNKYASVHLTCILDVLLCEPGGCHGDAISWFLRLLSVSDVEAVGRPQLSVGALALALPLTSVCMRANPQTRAARCRKYRQCGSPTAQSHHQRTMSEVLQDKSQA